jgi:hypothetical protein
MMVNACESVLHFFSVWMEGDRRMKGMSKSLQPQNPYLWAICPYLSGISSDFHIAELDNKKRQIAEHFDE